MAMVLADRKLWVTNTFRNSITEIDAATGRLIGILVGARYGFDHPVSMTAYRGRIWVANSDASTVTELVTALVSAVR
jgi:DNA-binding beta-propeller fold protein YncE